MLNLIEEAGARIGGHVVATPLIRSPFLSASTGAEVFLKLENLQWTGSFKLRGATNKLLSLPPEERGKGVVTASTGNHGAAVAFAGARFGVPTSIFAPESASRAKLTTIQNMGGEVHLVTGDALQSELAAREFGKDTGRAYISPYNDKEVIAGQGTLGIEILEQLPDVDTVIASVGGGGLISGVGSYLQGKIPSCKIVGASPSNSPAMQRSLLAGKIVDCESLPTLSDGTAGGIETDTVTFSLCQQIIDDFPLVEEAAIRTSMTQMISEHHVIVEGAAGVAVAATRQVDLSGRRVVVILCGGNLEQSLLIDILNDSAAP